VKRYAFNWRSAMMVQHPYGSYVRYDEANDLLQDERDKLARIQKVAQVAYDNWPHDTFLPAVQTILQICKDGKASPITEDKSSE
jgi:hypothetical protein